VQSVTTNVFKTRGTLSPEAKRQLDEIRDQHFGRQRSSVSLAAVVATGSSRQSPTKITRASRGNATKGKKGDAFRKIIRTEIVDGWEFSLHATKGRRARRHRA
jgi:hypothetical protein